MDVLPEETLKMGNRAILEKHPPLLADYNLMHSHISHFIHLSYCISIVLMLVFVFLFHNQGEDTFICLNPVASCHCGETALFYFLPEKWKRQFQLV